MKLHKIFKLALNMVLHSKLRSWLTILGIVIGVASVVAIIGLSNGMEASVSDRFSDMGVDLITITPGYSKATFGGPGGGHPGESISSSSQDPLTNKDVQALKSLASVKSIDLRISGSADVYFMGGEGTVSVTGVDQKVWSQFSTETIAQGRDLSSSDQNVVLIGGNLADDYFDNPVGINQILTLEGSAFRVVGILDDTSNSVYMPLNPAYTVLDDKDMGEYDSIIVKAKEDSSEFIDALKESMLDKLMIARHVNEKTIDFSLRANKDSLEQASEMLSTMTLFLTAIAAVSLLVGIVGVVNTMFTSVLEKKKEIGIMKAIGATNKDVMTLFLLNSGLMGLAGGIFGVIIGWIVASSLTFSMMRNASSGSVSLELVLFALAGSIVIGMLAGLIPAWNASRLKPVDSLRAE